MNCNICYAPAQEVFRAKILAKYEVPYFQCAQCGFLRAPDPFWLPESYASAITALDIGMLKRNLELREVVTAIVRAYFDPSAKFVDYGGGYGMLVRLLRDRGLDFYRQDIYAKNLFAQNFDVSDLGTTKFEVLTAFEVFEHLENPAEEIEKMLQLSDNILFSTELQPIPHPRPETWWYILPEIGQHISFFSKKSLEVLAKSMGLHLSTNGKNLHLLSRRKIVVPLLFKALSYHQIAGLLNAVMPGRKSLLPQDFDFLKQKLKRDNLTTKGT
ncbi:MAG: class I SAM-dependent methyltransferase [Saprospiraceae bacterium]